MRKTYYYFIVGLFVTLFFSVKANAATTTISISIPVTDGQNLTAYTQSYTDIYAEQLGQENAGSDTYVVFQPTFNIQLYGLNQQYLNGYIALTVNVNCSISAYTGWSYDGIEYTRPYSADGYSVYIAGNAYNYFRIYVIFDNYWNESGTIDLGTVTQKHQVTYGGVTPFKGSFTTSFSIYSNHLEKDQYIQNDRTTELMYSAIYQATGQQLADMLTVLNNIRNQDPVYYNQMIVALGQLHTDNIQQHNDLTSILNELDLDFAAVQTVLDLFPSYRTQVLQYWQDLLQMNAAQSSAAAEVESQYADRESQSSQLINGMGSLVMPSISSGDLDIMSSVDQTQKANFFGLIALITHNQLVTKIMLIIVLGAIVGYILYGKR